MFRIKCEIGLVSSKKFTGQQTYKIIYKYKTGKKMIHNSFIFLDGFGQQREQSVWNQGIHDWQTFISAKQIDGISNQRKSIYNLQLHKAQRNLHVNNIDYFQEQFPHQEHWRLFDRFKDDAVYLDIETSGYHGDITVIGLYDGDDTKIMVKGKNLDKHFLQKTLDRYKMIITFNGSSFDLPVIRKYFNTEMNQTHIDLRHVCSRIGLTGGLKNIEKQIGISRHDDVEGISGGDAALLWRMYKGSGDERYIKLLVQYNEEDIINLEPLAKHAIRELWRKTRSLPT